MDMQQNSAVTILCVTGRLDAYQAPRVERAIVPYGEATTRIIDLKEVEFLDLAGLRMLIQVKKQAKLSNHSFFLADLSVRHYRLITLINSLTQFGLPPFFPPDWFHPVL
jgi:anti-anti-sigma factor